MSALEEGIDLKEALRQVKAQGYACIPGALHAPFDRRLQQEIETGPFAPMPAHVGQVQQEVEAYELRGVALDAFPLVQELRAELGEAVRAQGKGIKGISAYEPNHVMVQRFKAGSIGITSHLDGRRFKQLVAVFTTKGAADLTILEGRRGDAEAEFPIKSGCLFLLRGPGFAGVEDGRRFHAIAGPKRGERFSVTLRMDAR